MEKYIDPDSRQVKKLIEEYEEAMYRDNDQVFWEWLEPRLEAIEMPRDMIEQMKGYFIGKTTGFMNYIESSRKQEKAREDRDSHAKQTVYTAILAALTIVNASIFIGILIRFAISGLM